MPLKWLTEGRGHHNDLVSDFGSLFDVIASEVQVS